MSAPVSPFESAPPPSRRILTSVIIALVGAAIVLVTVVLPAEYGIDPTGAGSAMGLTALREPARTLQIKDVVGGNEAYKEVPIPEFGAPIPLPNPAVFQKQAGDPKSETVTIALAPGQETEFKTVLKEAQVILYSWKVDRGNIYVDFHGHEPDAPGNAFVRYEELQEGSESHGSLVAPFAGEHGWFWLNFNEFPVTVTLTFSGYYDSTVDYGKLQEAAN
jgi:hypothetical protein